MQIKNKSYWDTLPIDIEDNILQHRSVILIQKNAKKMFYNKYGINWKNNIQNYQDDFDYYCYRYGINDPDEDYYNYYKYNDIDKVTRYDFP